ncbi:thioredoxin family protein [Amycolatopsis palatopharyngis]|uniref:thioredoxin family protein n=1 Tax=Amycolatopsis palatopharyngis TaxID=187982 RepID=UPI001B885135|nr:thioredoxin family protein [Amycolatopsis palatopharyngis]
MTIHSGQAALRVYVAPGCAGCRTARHLAEAVRQARPDHPIEVIDLSDQPDEPLPPGVIGTPTYVLGGEVISLGNPDLTDLLRRLDTHDAKGHDD